MNIDNEIRRNDFAFVLSDVFWTELHFSCLDIVASLDESSVKHDAEHCLVCEASVSEYYFHISLQQEAVFLLLC